MSCAYIKYSLPHKGIRGHNKYIRVLIFSYLRLTKNVRLPNCKSAFTVFVTSIQFNFLTLAGCKRVSPIHHQPTSE